MRASPGGTRLSSLAALLDVVADELLRVVLEDLVDLVEQVVDLGLQPVASLGGRRRLLLDRGASRGCVVDRFFSSRSAITVPYEPNRLSSSAGVSHPSKSVSTWRAVPLIGSIIGTRRSGSSPRSNTTESQLAATIADENRSRHRPRK